MNTLELIKTRRSVRTFDGRALTDEDREKLSAFPETIRNPFDLPVRFVFLSAKENGLSSPVISGEPMYVMAAVPKVPHGEEAFGYAFEKLVLYAWSLGIGTTWIGGTMNRGAFEKAAGIKPGERMCCVSPLGYPAKRMSIKEFAMRKGVKADARKEPGELFFEGSFGTPLTAADPLIRDALEAVRYAPSAVNHQPWRIVRIGNAYHFYEKHDRGYISEAVGDMQKVDMGIALCHFTELAGGTLQFQDPGLSTPEGTEYIATVIR